MACLWSSLNSLLGYPTYYPIPRIEQTAKPGDLIALKRGYLEHFVLYVGNGKVINVGAEGRHSTCALISEMTLEEIAEDSFARIENYEEYAQSRQLRAMNSETIIERARIHLGNILPYSFMFRNCEYYCTLWRYGVGFSKQVIEAKNKVDGMGSLRYFKFKEHRAICPSQRDNICRCTLEVLSKEMQILDLIEPENVNFQPGWLDFLLNPPKYRFEP